MTVVLRPNISDGQSLRDLLQAVLDAADGEDVKVADRGLVVSEQVALTYLTKALGASSPSGPEPDPATTGDGDGQGGDQHPPPPPRKSVARKATPATKAAPAKGTGRKGTTARTTGQE